nr:small hydrophobic protein [Mumps orthorubulavirus]BCU92931.1 small hydrophobic protein [Mumps orthorubulavirus]
MPAIQPPL